MAENVEILDIDLTQLNQETQETTKTLRELRKEVSDLRNTLNDTVIGTEEFEKTLGELESKQKELADVTKSSNHAIAGSYNDLAKQMADLKKQWKETADATVRSELGNKIKDLNDQLKEMDASVGNYQRNVGNYASALDGLGVAVVNLEGATKGVTNAFGSAVVVLNSMGVEGEGVARILRTMQVAMNLSKGMKDLEQGTKLFTKLGNTIKGVTATEKAFNVEQKASAVAAGEMATAQTASAAATTTASTAMKAFRTALISTGIGAIVVAIGLLIANFEKLTKWLGLTNDAAERYKGTNDKLNESFSLMNEQTERDVRLMRAQGASMDEIHEKQLRALETERAMTKAKMEAIKIDAIRLQQNRHWFDGGNKTLKAWEEEYKALAETYKQISKSIDDLNADFVVDKQIDAIERGKAAYAAAASAFEKAKQAFEAYTKTRMTNQQQLNKLAEDAARTTMSVREQEFADAKMNYYETLDNFKKLQNEELKALKTALEKKVITQKQYESRRQAVIDNYANVEVNALAIYQKKVQDLSDKYAKADLEKEKKKKEAKVRLAKEGYEQEMKLLEASFNEAATRYELFDDQVGLSQANETFLKNQELALTALKMELEQLGADTTDIDLKIRDVLLEQQQAFVETFELKAETLSNLTDQLSDTVGRLTSIGSGLSKEWATVFDTMSEGIQTVAKSLKTGQKGWKQYGAMAVSALNVASSMMVAMADEQDETTREGFEREKKYQIGAATMSMLGGILDAWTSAMSPSNAWMTIWGQLAAGAAMTAMITAVGLMQISKIKQTKFNGSGSGNEGGLNTPVAIPSLTALQSMDTGVDATTLIQGASTEGQVADTRVYVVETDIASVGSKVNVTQSEATF